MGLIFTHAGPIKQTSAAVAKAERKYNGDVFKVTDFCRAFLVAKDISTLLAIIEYVLSSCADDVKRIKLSTLKQGGENALEGGYRDCKINVVVDGHICEIQVHLEKLWKVAKVDGYQGYKKCLEEPIDSFDDPYRSLIGLQEAQLHNLLIDAAAEDGINTQYWHQYKDAENIRAFFALAGLYLKVGEENEANKILAKLRGLKMRTPSGEGTSLDVMDKYLNKKTSPSDKWADDDILCMTPDDLTATLCWVFPAAAADVDTDSKQQKSARQAWLATRHQKFEVLGQCEPADEALAGLTGASKK